VRVSGETSCGPLTRLPAGHREVRAVEKTRMRMHQRDDQDDVGQTRVRAGKLDA